MRLNDLLISATLATVIGCQSTSNAGKHEKPAQIEAPQNTAHHIEALSKIFDAHGGYAQWDKMKSLSYRKKGESTIADLKNRKILLTSKEQTIGFDGNEVWMKPDTLDASRARFYHNLYFYFYAMPFVVGDLGAYYELLPQRELGGKIYNQLKISYQEGIGDSSNDNYIILSNSETNQMEWLMYTVTYTSGEPSDAYKLIRYGEWARFGDLLLPTAIQWYDEQKNSLVASGQPVVFETISISEEPPEQSIFERPEGAQIAPR